MLLLVALRRVCFVCALQSSSPFPFFPSSSHSSQTIMKFGSYTISIVVDDQPLEEHQVEMKGDGGTTTCWIASEEGKVRSDRVLSTSFFPSSRR